MSSPPADRDPLATQAAPSAASAGRDSSAYRELKAHLCEMFQMDRGDLDFGIYRIMNMKRAEIEEFLESRLLPDVREVLKEYQASSGGDVQEELDRTIANLRDAGVDPDKSPKVIELRQKLASSIDVDKTEVEIYSHLYNFFKRYYSEGDFMSLRRYKEGVYALPYEGEEVKLHWATHDQYYIKTSEDLKYYDFVSEGSKRVRFEIVAANTEKNNNKAASDKQRRFMLAEATDAEGNKREVISSDGNQLTILFEYRADESKRKQDKINKDIAASLLAQAECLRFGLDKLSPTDGDVERTVLEKHLKIYTAKFTFDYFIHRDLGGFLRREFNFFVKNEIMHLDDIDNEKVQQVENYLAKIKALRKVAHKIIAFLAQIEDFQKKLWLKKKFVLETHYCVTLDHIIGSTSEADLLKKIAANDAQREEWVRLFAIDEVTGYGQSLSVEFLKANHKLQVDTRFFDAAFKYSLLELFDNLDEATDGVLIDSENFQALNLLQDRYKEQIKCIYIDPPYNTDSSPIIYKNNYKHSSWLSMIRNNLNCSKELMGEGAGLILTIDDEELYRVKLVLDDSGFHYAGTVAIQMNPGGRDINDFFATSHDYALFWCKDIQKFQILGLPREENGDVRVDSNENVGSFRRSGGLSTPDERPNSEFSFYISSEKIVGVGGCRVHEHPQDYTPEYVIYIDHETGDFTKISEDELRQKFPDLQTVMPVGKDGGKRVWRWSDRDKIANSIVKGKIFACISKRGISIKLSTPRSNLKKPKTIWVNRKYSSSVHGTVLLNDFFGERGVFGYPKSIYAAEDSLRCVVDSDEKNNLILDYFAGSGTTGHAVIKLNREDDGSRKYILVEMGEYFSTVTKPRVQKAAYSSDWKDGKPIGRDGVSQVIKYLALEQYEDTLDNLEMRLDEDQTPLLDANADVLDEYMLGYMMEVESAGSASLLNIDGFENPFDYQLNISRNDETETAAVDMIETFNYLLGLKVQKIKKHDNGIITVEGQTLAGEKTLVIWRNTKEIDNNTLDAWFKVTHLQVRSIAKAIYVNGDNTLENLKPEGQQWSVRLTEEEFKRRMFDIQDA